jgi:lysine 2,3-aminomutase
MQGMRHHRTSVKKGAELVTRLCASGEFSGRAKPHYALMTDIGKIVLYEGAIIARRPSDNSILLRSGYRLEDRKRWNPSWRVPASVEIDDEGFMCVWYRDGEDEAWGDLGLWGGLTPVSSNDPGLPANSAAG